MKHLLFAVTLMLASSGALAAQPCHSCAAQANYYSNEPTCSSERGTQGPQHTVTDRAEELGEPYYHGGPFR